MKKKSYLKYTVFVIFLTGIVVVQSKKEVLPEYYVDYARTVLGSEGGDIQQVFFSPDDNIKSVLLGLIHNEQSFIYVAQYRILDKDVIGALRQAMARKVLVIVITDCSSFLDKYEKITQLQLDGVEVRSYASRQGIMHNKFFIFGNNFFSKPIVVAGSANATLWGYTKNQENVFIINNSQLIKKYRDKFMDLIDKSTIPVLNLLLAKLKDQINANNIVYFE